MCGSTNQNSVAVELIRTFMEVYMNLCTRTGHADALEKSTEVVKAVNNLVQNVDR